MRYHGGCSWREEVLLVRASGGHYRVILHAGIEIEGNALLVRVLMGHGNPIVSIQGIIMQFRVWFQVVMGSGRAAVDGWNMGREICWTFPSL